MDHTLFSRMVAAFKEYKGRDWLLLEFTDNASPIKVDKDLDMPEAYEPVIPVKLALDAFATGCSQHNCTVYPGYQGVLKDARTDRWLWKVLLQVDCRAKGN